MFNRLFLNDKFILLLIILNAVVIFISGFEISSSSLFYLTLIDNLITCLFILELIVKFSNSGFREFFISKWNIFDFVLIALSIPSLIAFVFDLEVSNISMWLVLRIMRVFKSFRFLKFIPDIDHLAKGIVRALKASLVVIFGFIVYLFIIGVFSFYLFKNTSPEYFGNPLTALYSTFRIFTIEGWYDIPNKIVLNLSQTPAFFTYLYFIFVVLTGGILGLSLVNSIFVDAMVSDNNDELEEKIDDLNRKIDELLKRKEE